MRGEIHVLGKNTICDGVDVHATERRAGLYWNVTSSFILASSWLAMFRSHVTMRTHDGADWFHESQREDDEQWLPIPPPDSVHSQARECCGVVTKRHEHALSWCV